VAERYFPPVVKAGVAAGDFVKVKASCKRARTTRRRPSQLRKAAAPPKAAKKVKKVTKKVGAKKKRLPPPRLPEEEGDRQLKLSSDEGYCDEEDGYCEAHKRREGH
jgi:hypothetical protein